MVSFLKQFFRSLFIASLFFPTVLYSQEAPSWASSIFPFWERIRHTTSFSQIQHWNQINLQIESHLWLVKNILNQQIFQDHFFNKFKKRQKDSNPEETFLAVNKLMADFLDVLKNGEIQDIKQFMKNWTKEDKKLSFLMIAFKGWKKKKLFELIKALDLSLNDSLSLKDIHSGFIPENLRDSEETFAVLSHYLAGTGDISIIKKLIEHKDYNQNIKTAVGWNILHSFIILSYLRKENKIPLSSSYDAAFRLLIKNSEKIIGERDILKTSLWSLINQTQNISAGKAFMETDFFSKMGTWEYAEQSKSYKDILFYLIEQNSQTETDDPTSYKKQELTYFDIEPFVKNLAHSTLLTNPSAPFDELNSFYLSIANQWSVYENTRLKFLHKFLQRENSPETQETNLILEALFNRDDSFFKTIKAHQKKMIKNMNFFIKSGENPSFFITNFLLEAIRQSFLPAIRYTFDENMMETGQKEVSTSLDPLSLSIITYASLPENHPLKKEAQHIIRFLAKHIDPKKNYPFFINLTPITWAMLFGLYEEVEFLHEKKKIDLTHFISIVDREGRTLHIDIIDYLELQGFMNLTNYLSKKTPKGPNQEECKQIFLH